MGWTIVVLAFDSRLVLGIFLFTTASRTAPGPTQPSIQWVPGSLFRGLKLTTYLHLVPRSKNAWSCTSTRNTPPWCGAELKYRDSFNLTFTFSFLEGGLYKTSTSKTNGRAKNTAVNSSRWDVEIQNCCSAFELCLDGIQFCWSSMKLTCT
jgi:hypothetical protein